MSVKIPPFHAAIWFNGWLAVLLHPISGGMIAAGETANEDMLIEAMKSHLGEVKP